jgi:hypothetical protein
MTPINPVVYESALKHLMKIRDSYDNDSESYKVLTEIIFNFIKVYNKYLIDKLDKELNNERIQNP